MKSVICTYFMLLSLVSLGCSRNIISQSLKWRPFHLPVEPLGDRFTTARDLGYLKAELREEGIKMAAGLVAHPGSRPCPCENPSWCKPGTRNSPLETFIFSTNESNWDRYPYHQITSIATFKYYPDRFMCYAHTKGVKVIKTVNFPKDQLANITARRNWINAVVIDVNYHFIDGVNMDFEEGIGEHETGAKDGLTLLMTELSVTLKHISSQMQVTFDYAGNPNGGRHYDYKAISDVIDFAFIMDYDEIGGPMASANAPFPSIKAGIEDYLALGIASDKMVLGLPWYGYWFRCNHYDWKTHKCPVKDYGQINYDVILDNLAAYRITNPMWDNKTQTPYYSAMDPLTRQIIQIWYDNPKSLKIKFKLIKTYKLLGSGNWQADAVDYDDVAQADSMWNAFPQV